MHFVRAIFKPKQLFLFDMHYYASLINAIYKLTIKHPALDVVQYSFIAFALRMVWTKLH